VRGLLDQDVPSLEIGHASTEYFLKSLYGCDSRSSDQCTIRAPDPAIFKVDEWSKYLEIQDLALMKIYINFSGGEMGLCGLN
jgi:hypothetical protein